MMTFGAQAVAVTAIWLAAYRLPFSSTRTRQRVRLRLSSLTGVPSKYVFPVLGTVIYLVLGVAAAYVLGGPLTLLRWDFSLAAGALTVLAAAGASALTAFAMSVLYAANPRTDIPSAVTGVRWVQEILALPGPWRWIVPAASAAVEEFFFRGVVLMGLLALGAPAWAAIVIAGVLFIVGQLVLTETRAQAVVLGLSSVTISLIGGLLTVVEGSVLPAILIHASFAAYYTNVRRPG